ncbi:MAG: hypothetical protein AAGF11_52160 [Myxococcota bacterium]
MRSPGFVVMGGVALGLVGYAFYTLYASDPPRSRPAPARAAQNTRAVPDPPRDDTRAGRPPSASVPAVPRRAQTKPAPVPEVEAPAADEPTPGPPPRPKPEISLEEARERFAAYMEEIERLEAEGTTLTSPEWVDYYRRGHEVLLPLQQHLEWTIPEQAEELRRANDDMRTTLGKLEPRVPIDPP